MGEGMEIRGGEEGDQAISKLLRGWQGQQSKEQNLIYKEYTKTKALDGVLARSQPACRRRAVPRGLDAARQPGTSPVPWGQDQSRGAGRPAARREAAPGAELLQGKVSRKVSSPPRCASITHATSPNTSRVLFLSPLEQDPSDPTLPGISVFPAGASSASFSPPLVTRAG